MHIFRTIFLTYTRLARNFEISIDIPYNSCQSTIIRFLELLFYFIFTSLQQKETTETHEAGQFGKTTEWNRRSSLKTMSV